MCQQATKIILEPLFEADFLPCSFGFRPKRSAPDVLEKIRVAFPRGQQVVFETDILKTVASIAQHVEVRGCCFVQADGRIACVGFVRNAKLVFRGPRGQKEAVAKGYYDERHNLTVLLSTE